MERTKTKEAKRTQARTENMCDKNKFGLFQGVAHVRRLEEERHNRIMYESYVGVECLLKNVKC